MSDTDGPRQPSESLAFLVELEQDMGRTEIEIVEKEERKILLCCYKDAVAHVTSTQKCIHAPTCCGCLNNSSWNIDSGGKERWGRRSNMRPHAIDATEKQQRKEESMAFSVRVPPLVWPWNPLRAGAMRTSATQSENDFSHIARTPAAKSGKRHGVRCSSANEHLTCGSLSVSLCGDKRLHEDGKKQRWNSSSNLCSKAGASRSASLASNDLVRLQKMTVSHPLVRSQPSVGSQGLLSRRECHSLNTQTDFSIKLPKALIEDRFRRLNTLQDLLRMELEREAFEDWQVLRDEFIRLSCKPMELKQLGHTLRCEADNLEGHAGATVEISSWEREKRRQERRFWALELHNSQVNTVGSSFTVR
ncbi:ATP-dependent DEAD/H RNA helicase, putative [Trypanosoma cruzi marinkellei]|uniref:ATP-dependent DEAD/H RNA helicase, putative n=1 Tax=Trypanosoma cruzi marinkellei TaxID=85056 RepID=K2MKT6_TRYCR|nr:ATP-dependent DEAD/H RNA helicase, putative [Trypanosoma cruzi marinkellei]